MLLSLALLHHDFFGLNNQGAIAAMGAAGDLENQSPQNAGILRNALTNLHGVHLPSDMLDAWIIALAHPVHGSGVTLQNPPARTFGFFLLRFLLRPRLSHC